MTCRGWAILLAWVGLAGATPAMAAGGAHIIDDAAVETPGACHLESWVTHNRDGEGLVNFGPACTRTAWPDLELGGFIAHGWSRGQSSTMIGLSPKLMLRPEGDGLGIGLGGSIGFSIDQTHFETAALTVPLTMPVNDRVRLNVNAGWQWSKPENAHDLFIGAQAEIAIVPKLGFMIEGFTRDRGKAGGQAGLRWTTAQGAIDLDLLAGRYLDGRTPTALTFGITVRR